VRDAPPLIPIFRSPLQAEVLLHVLTGDRPLTAAELSRILHRPEPSVAREVRRLLDTGVIRGEPRGRLVLLHPDEDSPATAPLRQLLIVTYGPSVHLAHALTGVAGIEEAYVYGPWAARQHGEPGQMPHQVDLLLVGAPARSEVEEALEPVRTLLHRPVEVLYVTARRWALADVAFLARIKAGPLTSLVGPATQS